jgi:hypothetical protein
MMNGHRSPLTVENCLYLALFGAALALRLYQLNAHPLTDAEAREALTAFRLVRAQPEMGLTVPHSPAYFFFTYFGFLIFGASGAIARLAPALFGAGLVFLPMFFRDHLGRVPALLTGGLLAVSSAMLAASRSADGAIIALFGLGLGLGALRRYPATASPAWLIAGGAGLGLGLASGGAFLTGALAAGLATLIMGWVNPDEGATLREAWQRVRAQGAPFLAALGLTALVVATLGALYRPGLGALAGSWVHWLSGFVPSAAGRTPLTLLAFLLAYEPLILVFGVVGAIRAFRTGHRFGQWLSLFLVVALVFAVFYSGRTMFDLIWMAVPLAALAGWALVELLRGAWPPNREVWAVAAGLLGVIAVLLVFAAYNLAAFAEQVRFNPDVAQGRVFFSGLALSVSPVAYVYLFGLAVGLVFVVSYLFGLGWSPQAARLGLTLGASAALFAVSLSAGWGLTQLRPTSPVELWWARPTADDLNRLMHTLTNVSNYTVGGEHDVQVTAQAPPDGALAWALRDFPHARFVETLDPGVASPVVIAPADLANPTLGSAYVGQGFPFRYAWSPGEMTWPQVVGWLVYRRAPVQSERLVLWVRQDVAQLQTTGGQ